MYNTYFSAHNLICTRECQRLCRSSPVCSALTLLPATFTLCALFSQSNTQDMILLQWSSSGSSATINILVVHAMIILLTYRKPTSKHSFGSLKFSQCKRMKNSCNYSTNGTFNYVEKTLRNDVVSSKQVWWATRMLVPRRWNFAVSVSCGHVRGSAAASWLAEIAHDQIHQFSIGGCCSSGNENSFYQPK